MFPCANQTRTDCFSASSPRRPGSSVNDCSPSSNPIAGAWTSTCPIKGAMQLTMPAKVAYGFLIVALGMMLTDICKLMLAPTVAASTQAVTVQHGRRR
jgi:hypothetical protein